MRRGGLLACTLCDNDSKVLIDCDWHSTGRVLVGRIIYIRTASFVKSGNALPWASGATVRGRRGGYGAGPSTEPRAADCRGASEGNREGNTFVVVDING